MRTLVICAVLILVGCKGGESASVASADCTPTPYDDGTTVFDQIDYFSNGEPIGYFMESNSGYDWYKALCSNHFFGIDGSENIRSSTELIFSDSNCTVVVGEVFDYPLHYAADIYVFEFEGDLYQYHLGGAIGPRSNVYTKTPGGVCNSNAGPINNVRDASLLAEDIF